MTVVQLLQEYCVRNKFRQSKRSQIQVSLIASPLLYMIITSVLVTKCFSDICTVNFGICLCIYHVLQR